MDLSELIGPLVRLPSNPTRADLRAARKTLEPLAAMGNPQAAAELAAVNALARDLYPKKRVDADGISITPRRKGPRRRLIAEEDCMGPCPMCARERDRKGHGRGNPRRLHIEVERKPKDQRTDLDKIRGCGYIGDPLWPLMSGRIECPNCKGTGWAPRGKAQLNPLETMLHKTRQPLRGDVFQGTFAGTPSEQPGATTHRRGYMGNAMIGPMSEAESWEAVAWINADYNEATKRSTVSHPHAMDIACAMEAKAQQKLKAIAFDDDLPKSIRDRLNDLEGPHREYILGRRLVRQSRRDKRNLTPGQERRSTMERRIRQAQTEYNRQRRREMGWYTKQRAAAHFKKSLADMGVDLDAMFASLAAEPAKPQTESPAIMEAIRRGDLPPDLDPMPQPSSDELYVKVFHGRRRGDIGWVASGVLQSVYVARLGGGVERVDQSVKVVFDDGDFEMYHPADVLPLEDLED